MKTILVDAMGTFVDEETGMNQEMYKLLESYPNRKIVLTMAPDELMEKWGLTKLPYEVHTSKLDPRKTDTKYYEVMLAKFGLSAEDTIYFEHNREAVKVAESLGIATHFYDEDKKDLSALKQFLDENV